MTWKRHWLKMVFSFTSVILASLDVMTYYLNWTNIKRRLACYWSPLTQQHVYLLPHASYLSHQADPKQMLQPCVNQNLLHAYEPLHNDILAIDQSLFVFPKHNQLNNNIIIYVPINEKVKACPNGILNWYAIINETIGSEAVSVAIGPLGYTNSVFSRSINGHTWNHSQVFQSCLVIDDRYRKVLGIIFTAFLQLKQ